jgi:hypothetical protein
MQKQPPPSHHVEVEDNAPLLKETPLVTGVIASSVEITDSLAGRLLANERERLTLVAPAQPIEGGPVPCETSPTKVGDVTFPAQTAPETEADAEDFVVVDSVEDEPSLRAALRHSNEILLNDDDDDDDNTYRAEKLTLTGRPLPPPAAAMFASALEVGGGQRETLKPSQVVSPAPVRDSIHSPTTTHQQHRRQHEIRTAAQLVRQSLLSLRELLLETDLLGEGHAAGGEADHNPFVAQELSGVLADVLETVRLTSSTSTTTSRPTSQHYRESPQLLMPSVPLLTPTVMVGDSVHASEVMMNTAAASAAQFQVLWSELQQLREQNASILAVLSKSTLTSVVGPNNTC